MHSFCRSIIIFHNLQQMRGWTVSVYLEGYTVRKSRSRARLSGFLFKYWSYLAEGLWLSYLTFLCLNDLIRIMEMMMIKVSPLQGCCQGLHELLRMPLNYTWYVVFFQSLLLFLKQQRNFFTDHVVRIWGLQLAQRHHLDTISTLVLCSFGNDSTTGAAIQEESSALWWLLFTRWPRICLCGFLKRLSSKDEKTSTDTHYYI